MENLSDYVDQIAKKTNKCDKNENINNKQLFTAGDTGETSMCEAKPNPFLRIEPCILRLMDIIEEYWLKSKEKGQN